MNTASNILRVAALPLNIQWGNREANLDAVEVALKHLPLGTDVVVLPELFSTGYIDDAEQMRSLAERNTGATIDRIKEWAAHYSVAIAGSYLASTPPHIYNRGFFIEPSGEETFYDKHHLFSRSNEGNVFRAGDESMPIVRFRGWNIAMIICYDLRFPVWCRSKENSYDMLLVPANWPQARAYAFEHLLIARAIENQAVVVGANRGGSDKFGDFEGLTRIYDYLGQPVGTQVGPFIMAEVSRTKQDEFRQRFPVSRDADDFTILDRNRY